MMGSLSASHWLILLIVLSPVIWLIYKWLRLGSKGSSESKKNQISYGGAVALVLGLLGLIGWASGLDDRKQMNNGEALAVLLEIGLIVGGLISIAKSIKRNKE